MSRLAKKVGRFWIVGRESSRVKYTRPKKPYIISVHGYRQLYRDERVDHWVLNNEVTDFARHNELIFIIDEFTNGSKQPVRILTLFLALNSRGEVAWIYSDDI